MKMFLFYCYIVFQFVWIHSHSLSLPSDKLRKCCEEKEGFIYSFDSYDNSDNYQCVPRDMDDQNSVTDNDNKTLNSFLHPLNLTDTGCWNHKVLFYYHCLEQTVIMCGHQDILSTARIIVMSISIVCIVILIICNCACDELRNNHVTAIKIPFLFFLTLSFVIEVIRNEFFPSLVTNTIGCIITGLLFQFSALSTLFWLTCFSVEVWLRFRKIPDIQDTEVSRNHFYFPVSILGPAIITILTMIMQFVADQDEAGYIHPRLDKESSNKLVYLRNVCILRSVGNICSFGHNLSHFLYFHLIFIILVGINLLLFLAMIYVLIKGPWTLFRVRYDLVNSGSG